MFVYNNPKKIKAIDLFYSFAIQGGFKCHMADARVWNSDTKLFCMVDVITCLEITFSASLDTLC